MQIKFLNIKNFKSIRELEIRDVDMGAVTVTNRTDGTFYDLELTYKNYLADADVYQGGIAYRCTVDTLHPGQSITLYPSHYAAGYSRFVYACCPSALP